MVDLLEYGIDLWYGVYMDYVSSARNMDIC